MPDINSLRSSLHVFVWILSIVTCGVMANVICINCDFGMYQDQFVDAAIYGHLIVSTIVCAALFLDEEIPKKTMYVLTYGGALLQLIATFLLLVIYIGMHDQVKKKITDRILVAVIFCALIAVTYVFEFVASLVNIKILN